MGKLCRAILLLLAWGTGAAYAGPCMPAGGDAPFTVTAGADGTTQSGTPIPIAWKVPWAEAKNCPGASYLVLAMPKRVRFGGEGFLVVAPGEAAPLDIPLWHDMMRVFVPLSDAREGAGELTITPYLLGTFNVGWAIVHLPAGNSSGGMHTISQGSAAFHVRPGRPRVIVQDLASTETPQETVLSNSGEFRLDIFDGHFRVSDLATGALVYAGQGRDPTFSPTSRFLHATGLDGEEESLSADLKVVDLHAEEEVLDLARAGWSGRGNFVTAIHWSPGDGFMLVSFEAEGAIGLKQTMTDRPMFMNEYGCGACEAQSDGIAIVDVSEGTAAIGWGSAFDVVDLLYPANVLEPDAGSLQAIMRRAAASRYSGRSLDDRGVGKEGRRLDLNGTPTASFELHSDAFENFEPTAYAEHRTLDKTLPARFSPAGSVSDRGGASLVKGVQGVNHTSRIARRLEDMGLAFRSGAPIYHTRVEQFTRETEDVTDDEDEWSPSTYHFLTGDVLRKLGLATSEEAAKVGELSATLTEQHEVCMVNRADTADVWSLSHGSGAVQFIHYRCRVGTGYAPEGLLAMIRLSGGDATLSDLAISPDYDTGQEEGEGSYDMAVGGDVPVAAHGALTFHRLNEDLVAIVGEDGRITVFDVERDRIHAELDDVPDAAQIELLALTAQSQRLLQINRDGRFHVHDPASGALLLGGLYVDDEVVIYDNDLNFEATPDGARHVHFKFPGDRNLYSLDQLGSRRGREDFVRGALAGRRAGQNAATAQPNLMPPRIEDVGLVHEDGGARLVGTAFSDGPLAHVSLYRDGIEVARLDAVGNEFEIDLDLVPLAETTWFAVRATDRSGLVSRTHSLPWDRAASATGEGRLVLLAAGTDIYEDRRISDLAFAGRDAHNFAGALSHLDGRLYGSVETHVLENAPNLASQLIARIEASAASLGPQDTFMLHLAGHGFRGENGGLYLAGTEASMDDLAGTALDWSEVVEALGRVKARTVVFIDACHSGAAEAATNDDAVSALMADELPFAVIAASKGRQLSHEGSRFGGGAFTTAMIRAIAERERADLNGNGVIELSELYASIKRDVVLATDGAQTPWIARSGFGGEVPLF